jgi:hypothetical protein
MTDAEHLHDLWPVSDDEGRPTGDHTCVGEGCSFYITPADLRAAERLARFAALLAPVVALREQATQGPWRNGAGEPFEEPNTIVCPTERRVTLSERVLFRANGHFTSDADIAFVIAAERVIPALAALLAEGTTREDETDRAWRIVFTCCGREDGSAFAKTWEEANALRDSYVNGIGVHPNGYSAPTHEPGHRRSGVIRRRAALPAEGTEGTHG